MISSERAAKETPRILGYGGFAAGVMFAVQYFGLTPDTHTSDSNAAAKATAAATAVADLRREFDEHKRQYERALDRRDREFAEYKQSVRMTLYTGDISFLTSDLLPPPAAAMEAMPEIIEIEPETRPEE